MSKLIQLKNGIDDYDVNNRYSASEQVIGTWIDGKPIYRRVVDVSPTTALSANNWATIATVDGANVDTLVTARVFRAGKRQQIHPLEVAISTAGEHEVVQAWDVFSDGSINRVIIEYTKTTD